VLLIRIAVKEVGEFLLDFWLDVLRFLEEKLFVLSFIFRLYTATVDRMTDLVLRCIGLIFFTGPDEELVIVRIILANNRRIFRALRVPAVCIGVRSLNNFDAKMISNLFRTSSQ